MSLKWRLHVLWLHRRYFNQGSTSALKEKRGNDETSWGRDLTKYHREKPNTSHNEQTLGGGERKSPCLTGRTLQTANCCVTFSADPFQKTSCRYQRRVSWVLKQELQHHAETSGSSTVTWDLLSWYVELVSKQFAVVLVSTWWMSVHYPLSFSSVFGPYHLLTEKYLSHVHQRGFPPENWPKRCWQMIVRVTNVRGSAKLSWTCSASSGDHE